MARTTKKQKVNLVLDLDGTGKIVRLRLDFAGGQDDRADAVCDFLHSVAECAELSLVYRSDGDKGCPCAIVDCTPETQADILKMREESSANAERVPVKLADGRELLVQADQCGMADDLVEAGVSFSEATRILNEHFPDCAVHGNRPVRGSEPVPTAKFANGDEYYRTPDGQEFTRRAADLKKDEEEKPATAYDKRRSVYVPVATSPDLPGAPEIGSGAFLKTLREANGFGRAMELHNTEAMHSVVYERIRMDRERNASGVLDCSAEYHQSKINAAFFSASAALSHLICGVGGGVSPGARRSTIKSLRLAAVEAAARALALVECIDREELVPSSALDVSAMTAEEIAPRRTAEDVHLCPRCKSTLEILDQFELRAGAAKSQFLEIYMCVNEECSACKETIPFYELGGMFGEGDPSGFYGDKPKTEAPKQAAIIQDEDDRNPLDSFIGENDFPPVLG